MSAGSAASTISTVDSAAKRLYLSHGTEVVVIDTATNTIVGRIPDTPGVHGIAIAPNGKGFITAGQENKVAIFDLKTMKVSMKVDTGANPDAIVYEPKHKEIYSLNHTGKSVTVIDADSGKVVTTIPLSGVAESGAADPDLGRVYVNIEDTSAVDVIDINTKKVIANWKVAPAEEPTGMAIDTQTASRVRRRRAEPGDARRIDRQGRGEREDLRRHRRDVLRRRARRCR